MKAKDLVELGMSLFSARSSLMLLWQEIAANFYVERADFTYGRTLGTDFAGSLMTSYPLLCRRDLGDQTGMMLRPTGKEYAHMKPTDPGRENSESKRWMEWATQTQRRAMFDKKALYTTASVQADHDFSAFGQSVTSVRLSRHAERLLYRTWHLRDCAWVENEDGVVAGVFRKFESKARDLQRMFGDKIHQHVKDMLTQNRPLERVHCLHMVVEAEMYDDEAKGRPYWSIYWDLDNEHLLEAIPTWNKEYNVARWQTVSGSQYAFSPATVAALPEGRLLQSMTYTLLEAGEKLVTPAMIATQDVVRSDVDVRAGGVTWVDRDYDERLGEALRPLTQDARGMPLGLEGQTRSQQILSMCFYLNKLSLPQRGTEMTAYEVGQRIQEYIRGALPLFAPMEEERNGGDWELTFDLMRRHGAFGSPMDMPKILQDADVQFGFVSPLHDAIGAQLGAKFLEAKGLIAQAVELDPGSAALLDGVVALRAALDGIGVPTPWVRDEVSVQQIQDQQNAAAAANQSLEAMEKGASVAKDLATAQASRALTPA